MDRSELPSGDLFGSGPAGAARSGTVELVGPHLRAHGRVSLGRFHRISDWVNNHHDYFAISDARLIRRNGDPTDLVVPRLLVNPDEIAFLAQRADDVAPAPTDEARTLERPLIERVGREVVVFTADYTLTGKIFMLPDADFGEFVDSPDPRFVAMVDVTVRSPIDRRIVGRFVLAMVNRMQIVATSLLDQAGGAAETGVSLD